MEENIQDSIALLARVVDAIEQDCPELAKNLGGDVMDAYRQVVRRELDVLLDAHELLLRAMK